MFEKIEITEDDVNEIINDNQEIIDADVYYIEPFVFR